MDPGPDFEQRLELFFGAASDAVARVYARLSDVTGDESPQLAGSLRGPECRYGQTLPADFALVDRGRGPSLLAEAVVPEPCFWTPEMPHLYQATLELRRNDQVVARSQRTIGLRTLGAVGKKLIFDGRRWVLRGVRADSLRTLDLEQLHAADMALLTPRPDDQLLRDASELGVLVVAELDRWHAGELARLARWPALGIVVLDADQVVESAGLAPNVMLAARMSPTSAAECPAWARQCLVEADSSESMVVPTTSRTLPVVASVHARATLHSAASARMQCDILQRDLSARDEFAAADFAGYIV